MAGSSKEVHVETNLHNYDQCCKKRSTRPINHRLGATGPQTLPIYVTGSNKKVNRGQWRSMVVKLAGNLKILPEVPKTHRKLILITYSNCLNLLHVFLQKYCRKYLKLAENTQNFPEIPKICQKC